MKINVLSTLDEIATEVAHKVSDVVNQNPHAVLGLATGSSPVLAYQALCKMYKKGQVSFANVTSFNLDEYLPPIDHKDSYRYFMEDNLFNDIDIRKNNTNFPSPTNKNEYDSLIQKAGGIDLQILGVGPNGHIAFNEPNTPFDSKTHVVELTEETREANARFFQSITSVPTEAVTMGLATIMQAREIIIIVTGESKVQALKDLLSAEISVRVPSSILKSHPAVHLYTTKHLYDLAVSN